MSVGPQLQLAVLWPWLLMAMLQIRLGYSGLALVAAMEAERTLAQKAIIRVIPFKLEPLTLEGVFASIAEITPAEGKLLQFHPLSLCNTSEDEHTVPGFVSIVKLERPERDLRPCLSLANKAKLAGERGARAVLFDITDDQSAADQLRKPRGLSHPVVLIWGHNAELLMRVVNNNREAHVKIEVKEMPAWPDYDVWILLTVVSTVLVIVIIFFVRTRCQPGRNQTNVQEVTLQAINRLAIRRYQAPHHQAPTGDSVSTCSSPPICAICLEEFCEGQITAFPSHCLLLLYRNYGSSPVPMSSIGSVWTLGSSSTKRVHYACSTLLIGFPLFYLGILVRINTILDLDRGLIYSGNDQGMPCTTSHGLSLKCPPGTALQWVPMATLSSTLLNSPSWILELCITCPIGQLALSLGVATKPLSAEACYFLSITWSHQCVSQPCPLIGCVCLNTSPLAKVSGLPLQLSLIMLFLYTEEFVMGGIITTIVVVLERVILQSPVDTFLMALVVTPVQALAMAAPVTPC
ncbi:E3 ubiquitin-protein ligase RNF43 isoform X2 [Python bivittatus]|uniref:E3 ubiquitin-protein ligase RNF43 n=1 Tax=Python bivittatus TaxID=176946 RepID=A0A9F5ISX4_PYTBI|nr:E3 ubiquitin-protein ligase RNF43 isoform X2 [Python bivittatus]